ncbi:hypothetical protein MPSEU_000283900 [Mayamaea pseudoterrestris]|nr:hypothetical protein MPSEU_000283900 [Mayamaea pseudoterrestris]
MRSNLTCCVIWSIIQLSRLSAFTPQLPHRPSPLRVTQALTMTTLTKSNEPLVSPVLTEKREIRTVSTTAFIAILLAAPVFAVTVLPLSLFYQVVKMLLSPFRHKQELPKLDSGYEVNASQIVPKDQRKYDIVLLGATGFVGRLAVRHLAQKYGCDGTKVRWAIAGRSQAKLNKLKEKLAKELGMEGLKQIDCIIVDTSVPTTMPALVEQTRVVATTAGPYALYGSSVVEFCAKFGTNYVDITGEIGWVKAMAALWNATARETGAKLISFCGHDSIPWDLSVMKLQSILKKECNDNLVSASFWDQAIGGLPGGTFATALHSIDGVPVKHVSGGVDPFLRSPNGSKSEYVATPKLPVMIAKAKTPWDGPNSKRWTMPFIMAPINAQVVQWSHALRQEGSKTLLYTESYLMPDFKSAFVSFVGLILFGMSLFNPLTKYFARKAMPAPGEGPPMEAMEKKHYLCVYGEGIGEKGNRVESIFYLPQDAGCLETSRMLIESGLCMALQEKELLVKEGGFWTPSTALGEVLDKRLQDIGMQWSARVVPINK